MTYFGDLFSPVHIETEANSPVEKDCVIGEYVMVQLVTWCIL